MVLVNHSAVQLPGRNLRYRGFLSWRLPLDWRLKGRFHPQDRDRRFVGMESIPEA